LQAWRLDPGKERQISIVSDMPSVLSLPWELLHDEQGFLALRTQHPVSIVRRLFLEELPAFSNPFTPPLRILLVTARPDDAGFIDPRSIARELVEEIAPQEQEGAITLEFLRPPTLSALRARLSDSRRPQVHVLHFDGHGAFGEVPMPQDGLRLRSSGSRGMLAFENEEGEQELVSAEELAQVLQDSGVRLAVFNACQSAQGAMDDVFSSVAARLLQGGIDAVVAMSASVLVASAIRYVEAFYRALATGDAVPLAHERARQALHDDPHRHLSHRYQEEEGEPIRLSDWWLPHYYQQRPLLLEPTTSASTGRNATRTRKRPSEDTTLPIFNEEMPAEPRYGFRGRSRELLQIERALLQKKLVIIHGFGGMGKTALVREAADWFTRTGFYQRACFVSFEQGGDAVLLLGALGRFLGIYDGSFNPNDLPVALARVLHALKKQRILVLADNLESILPEGEASLAPELRAQLWSVLLDLRKQGAGVLLTTRDTDFGESKLAPGKNILQLRLDGLSQEDAYLLASKILTDLGIDRMRAPYTELRALLAQLDEHPLAIQLVLPALRDYPLSRIRADFAALLPTFVDDTASGRNRSLLASLDYSLHRLGTEQRALLSRLALFEGGANEDDLLAITEIPESVWASLRSELEQAALLLTEPVHPDIRVPFLHLHPVLVPFLRSQPGADQDASLRQRYVQRYYGLANYLDQQDIRHPEPVRAMARRELPNLRHALALLLEERLLEEALGMADYLAHFLTIFGMLREREQWRKRLNRAMAERGASTGNSLTRAENLHELGQAQDERERGNVRAAFTRLSSLLARIQAQPTGTPVGPGSFIHCRTLEELGRCLLDDGQQIAAEVRLREALAILERLLEQEPDEDYLLRQHAIMFNDLGTVLMLQGEYSEAKVTYEQALKRYRALQDSRNVASALGGLGILARWQGEYAEARTHLLQALEQFEDLGEPASKASIWYNLGYVALEAKDLTEAERCLRESLSLYEGLGNVADAADCCNALANVAERAGRLGKLRAGIRERSSVSSRSSRAGSDMPFA
jgi:tetratricopeptide (TPR) repeat protein